MSARASLGGDGGAASPEGSGGERSYAPSWTGRRVDLAYIEQASASISMRRTQASMPAAGGDVRNDLPGGDSW